MQIVKSKSHLSFFASRFQFVHSDSSESLVFNGKGRVYHLRNIIGQDPIERFVQVRIDSLNVVQGDGFIQEHLVERCSEATIDMVAMEDSSANNPSHKVEVRQVVWIDTTVRIDLQGVNIVPGVLEQTVVWVEHLVAE